MKTYTFLKDRQDNKWCVLKKFDFSNRTKKSGQSEYFLKVDKIINDVPLKSLTFQTGQKKWDGGSNFKTNLLRGVLTSALRTFVKNLVK